MVLFSFLEHVTIYYTRDFYQVHFLYRVCSILNLIVQGPLRVISRSFLECLRQNIEYGNHIGVII